MAASSRQGSEVVDARGQCREPGDRQSRLTDRWPHRRGHESGLHRRRQHLAKTATTHPAHAVLHRRRQITGDRARASARHRQAASTPRARAAYVLVRLRTGSRRSPPTRASPAASSGHRIGARMPPVRGHIDDEHDPGLPGRGRRGQSSADGIDRVDRRVRLVAHGGRSGDRRCEPSHTRGSAPAGSWRSFFVLHAPAASRAARRHKRSRAAPRRRLRRRPAIDPRQPTRHRGAQLSSTRRSSSPTSPSSGRGSALRMASADILPSRATAASDSRTIRDRSSVAARRSDSGSAR